MIRAFDNLSVDGARLSEDYSFCHRWRRLCGGEIWANTQHTITHVGLRHFAAPFDKARRGPRIVVGKLPAAVKTRPAPNQGAGEVSPPDLETQPPPIEAVASKAVDTPAQAPANGKDKAGMSQAGKAFLGRLRQAVDKATER